MTEPLSPDQLTDTEREAQELEIQSLLPTLDIKEERHQIPPGPVIAYIHYGEIIQNYCVSLEHEEQTDAETKEELIRFFNGGLRGLWVLELMQKASEGRAGFTFGDIKYLHYWRLLCYCATAANGEKPKMRKDQTKEDLDKARDLINQVHLFLKNEKDVLEKSYDDYRDKTLNLFHQLERVFESPENIRHIVQHY